MARKSKPARGGAAKPAGRRKLEAGVAVAEATDEPTVGTVENTIVLTTTICLLAALALLIMANGRVG